MLIVGLTGSIGMGKSTAAARFRERGIHVFDADEEVRRLYEGGAVPLIEAAFPGTTAEGRVNREKLSEALGTRNGAFTRLEAIVHPLVRDAERTFLQSQASVGAKMAVLEVPLLLESGAETRVDAVIVVSASPEVQRQRVLARPGMTPQKFEQLKRRQMSEDQKKAKADFVVDTSGAIAGSAAQIDDIIDALLERTGSAYESYWS